MRTAEDYKKLVEGYSFGLSLLKQINKKLYDRIMLAKDLLNKHDSNFAKLVRNLRVDYFNENDNKEADYPEIVTIDRGLYKEIFALSYSPDNDYIFAMLYERRSILGKKSVFCEIVPRTLEDIKNHTITDVLRISTLDEQNNVNKVYNYVAGIAEDSLLVLKQDVDKPNAVKDVLEIQLSEIENIKVDVSNMF